MSAYDRALETEQYMADGGISANSLTLLDTIRRVVDNDDDYQDPVVAEHVTRLAFEHFHANGGIEYDVSAGDFYYAVLFDTAYDALRDAGFISDHEEV